MAERNERDEDPGLRERSMDAAPGLARIAATAWWRTAGWTLETSMRASSRVARAAFSGEAASELVEDTRRELREQARRLLGVTDIEDRIRSVAPTSFGWDERPDAPDPDEILRDRGSELLTRSADVDFEQGTHPAYERILSELAPDEARVLRLLWMRGPQAAVDVRTARPLGIGSELVAPGLSMIGSEAGCRHHERVPAYLNNLFRLGLIWFSRDPVPSIDRYQVLEAQPDVVAARKQGGRTTTVRRSIQLTPFGADFCKTCLPMETSEFEAVPASVVPPSL